MRPALKREAWLTAPTVGVWRPAIGVGSPVAPGVTIGRLERLGRPLEVRAPDGAFGVAVVVHAAGAWVAYDAHLVELGEGAVGTVTARTTSTTAGGPEGAAAVRADTDGTVWLAPKPGASPYVSEGSRVAEKDTLLLVEVMKTFSPVRAPHAGTVVRIDVSTGQGVEAGAPLVWIRPD